MNMTREDAATALQEILVTEGRASRLYVYHQASPHFILGGIMWVVANTVTDLDFRWGGMAWLAVCVVCMPISIVLMIRQGRAEVARRQAKRPQSATKTPNMGMITFAAFAAVAAVFVLFNPLGPRQINATISLMFTIAYMMAGAWVGWRLFITGVVTTLAILFGYVALREHYFLWMGLVGGSGLIAAGLWLRRV